MVDAGGFSGVRHIPTDAEGMPLNAAAVSYGSDSALRVEFYLHRSGKDYIRIDIPGGNTRIDRKCDADDRARFPGQWERYLKLAKGINVQVGTPLSECSFLGEEAIAELNVRCVSTVEQLAALNDHAIQSLGPGTRQQVTDARIWLATRDQRIVEETQAENIALKNDLRDMKAQLAMLVAGMNGGKTGQPIGPEGPAKNLETAATVKAKTIETVPAT